MMWGQFSEVIDISAGKKQNEVKAMSKPKCVSEIENLITQVAAGLDCHNGKMSKDNVIEKLKICLWEIENDKQTQEYIKLGMAVEFLIEKEGIIHDMSYDGCGYSIITNKQELLEWHEQQKGGN